LVIVSHTVLMIDGKWIQRNYSSFSLFYSDKFWYGRLFDLGYFAVFLFFTLSGFTLYISNKKYLYSLKDIFPFIIKRVARIWPAYLVSILIYTIYSLLFWIKHFDTSATWIANNFMIPNSLMDFLKYCFLLFDFFKTHHFFIGPYWSLPIEFQYYLLLIPVAIFMGRFKSINILIPLFLGIVMMIIGTTDLLHIADNRFFLMVLSFLGGVALAEIYMVNKLPRIKNQIIVLFFIFLSFLAASSARYGIILRGYSLPFNIMLSIMIVYLFLCIKQEKHGSSLLIKLLGNYGTYSYSIYLYHILSLGCIAIIATISKVTLDIAMFFPILILTSISSYYLGFISYTFIEAPCIDFGRIIVERLRIRQKPGQPFSIEK